MQLGSKRLCSDYFHKSVIYLFHFCWTVIIHKQFVLFQPCVLLEAHRSICKGSYFIFICHFNESWTLFIFKPFMLIVFLLQFFVLRWLSLTHTHTHKCRYPSITDSMGNNSAMTFSDSEDLVYHAEYEGDEDCEVPRELARLLQ